jgi:hypothetical protein
VIDGLRYGELPAGFGAAIGTAHATCAATVAAARETWRAGGDDSAYLRATLDAIIDAERELYAACGDVRARSMTEAAQMIAGPYELRAHERQCRADIAEARRLRARDAVGPVVCERVDAVHAVTQQRVDRARQRYLAGGAQRDYLACIHHEQREAQRQLDAILADLGDGAWAAADQPRLDAYGHRARHDERERYAAERDDR